MRFPEKNSKEEGPKRKTVGKTDTKSRTEERKARSAENTKARIDRHAANVPTDFSDTKFRETITKQASRPHAADGAAYTEQAEALLGLYNEREWRKIDYERILKNDAKKFSAETLRKIQLYAEGVIDKTQLIQSIPLAEQKTAFRLAYAQKAYLYAEQKLGEVQRRAKQYYREKAADLLEQSDNFKDISGLKMRTLDTDRLFKEVSRIAEGAYEKLHQVSEQLTHNEAELKRDLEATKEQIRKLNISERVEKGNGVSEDAAIQFLGELEGTQKQLTKRLENLRKKGASETITEALQKDLTDFANGLAVKIRGETSLYFRWLFF